MSLRTRMVAVAGLAVAIAILCSAALVYVGVRSELRAEVRRSLESRARVIVKSPRRPPPNLPRPQLPASAFGGARGYVQLVGRDGRVLRPAGDASVLPVDARGRAIARRGTGRRLTDMRVAGTHLLVLTVGAGSRGAAQVARPLNEVDRELRRILVLLVAVALGGIALAAALGALVARTALAPIARFTRRTEAITADPGFSERMEVTGTDELGRLAQSFNKALDALELSLETQQQLIADASHELRTPIASLRTNIEVLHDAGRLPPEEREQLRADVLEELDQLTELVADVVELARGTKPGELLDDVRLDVVVEAAVERARRRAGTRWRIEAHVEPTVIRGESDRVGRAVSNLLDNALKWSPEGSVVDVQLREGTLSVRDHGPGFARDDLPHVFERFYRGSGAGDRPGSGLGLAIVKQAADAHGGRVEACDAPGGGALIRLWLGAPLEFTHPDRRRRTRRPRRPSPSREPASP